MKIRKIYIAALLALASVGCSDDEFSEALGEGTTDAPYRIWNKEQLMALADSAAQGLTRGRHYIQVKDIDLGCSENNPWKPIGYFDLTSKGNHTPFMGIYDGDGHKITGLYIYNESDSTAGLFGFALNAEIRNLTVSGNVYSKKNGIAGICGYLQHSDIENCINNADISAIDSAEVCNVGGICGYVNGYALYSRVYTPDMQTLKKGEDTRNKTSMNTRSTITSNDAVIKNCTNNGTVFSKSYAGGVCGYINTASVENCTNTAKISGWGDGIGGVCGGNYNDALVTSCKNFGDVLADTLISKYIGGICGDSYNDAVISSCENQGSVCGYNDVAGISGYSDRIENCVNHGFIQGKRNVGGIAGFHDDDEIVNCTNFGQIGCPEFLGEYVGGVVGRGNASILNCYNAIQVNGTKNVGGVAGYGERIMNVYNTGTVTGDSLVSGIGNNGRVYVAYNVGSVITNDIIAYGIQSEGYSTYAYWLESIAKIGMGDNSVGCSAFNVAQTLATSAEIDGRSYTTLLESLNVAVELYKTDYPELKSWKIVPGENNGYPMFE